VTVAFQIFHLLPLSNQYSPKDRAGSADEHVSNPVLSEPLLKLLHLPRGRISFLVKESGAIPRIPKGFRLKAQSCPDPSGLLWGSVHQRSSTPTGLRLLAPDGRARTSRNPVGVVLFVALLTQG